MKVGRSAVLGLVILPILLVSINNIKAQGSAANVLRLAKAVENSAIVSTELVNATLSDAVQNAVTLSCQDQVSRSIVTLYAYLLNQQLEESLKPVNSIAISKNLLAAVDHRLICSPTDGNAWLVRAQTLQFQKPNRPEMIASLANSYHDAPAESWVIQARFYFALANYDFVESKLEPEFSTDLNIMVQYAPIETVAKNYYVSNSSVRNMIYEDLVRLPKRRRDMVAQASDRLGVTLRGNSNCLIGESQVLDRDELSAYKKVQLEICGG